MATVVSLSGSPSSVSRTTALLRHVDGLLVARGHEVVPLEARGLPAEALLRADTLHPAIAEVIGLVERSDAVVVGTPVYKAAYSGLLKVLLDVLPQHALDGKAVLPLATGGTTAHVLAIDYALRPVLASMGAAHIAPGWFTLDKDIALDAGGGAVLAEKSAQAIERLAVRFSDVLDTRTPAVVS
ncbi:NADPH-dependent FMN reductase [Streptomyces resistomycificus]|uniref:NADPH-dependent FMN reductase n=1 Tax=Streptomyces resistomycificus TaxID=67356 RepID=A0A0L8LFZ8_9ACTN|nr:NADPH-dependent FMN reductase [Streptomyces resistomycificus]KOG37052.1 NADPH-dependent FMN reductase [Streptomyces resistomycificus]KUN94999.1 NADPH-dependent FMN reductase [Streptomyces resistomycificus]